MSEFGSSLSGEKGLGLKSWISGPGRKGTERSAVLDHRRVAVLPFASMSPNPDDEYFADGMTEEVISTLSRVPEIEVISRTSVMQYKKNPRPLKEVSRELGVGTILEGGVRKAGNHLRITVQMIDASKDRNLWSETYDRELHDVFAIQSEVASKVAEALKIKPENREVPRKSPTASTEAYTLYLKGRFHWSKRGLDDIRTALNYFQRSVKEDPKFAPGYVGLADCHLLFWETWQLDREENHEKARAAIETALVLDPGLAEAHASKGLLLTAEFRFREAAKYLEAALRINPNYAPAHLWLYQILLARLRWKEALEHVEKAVELDPLSTNMNINHGSYYLAKHDYPTGLALIKRAITLDPGFAMGHMFLGGIYGLTKMIKEAQAEYEMVDRLLEKQYPMIRKSSEAYLALFANDKETVRRVLPGLEADPDASLSDGTSMATFHFYLGEYDKGFEWLERSFEKHDQSLLSLGVNPFISDNVRSDPRYQALMKKLDLG